MQDFVVRCGSEGLKGQTLLHIVPDESKLERVEEEGEKKKKKKEEERAAFNSQLHRSSLLHPMSTLRSQRRHPLAGYNNQD